MGKNIKNPTITEVIADIKTAPAATSLANLAVGFISGLTKSTSASSIVFISSRVMTSDIVKTTMANSSVFSFKIRPKNTTTVANNRWILKFGSFLNADFIPSKAKEKLFGVECFLLILLKIYYF